MWLSAALGLSGKAKRQPVVLECPLFFSIGLYLHPVRTQLPALSRVVPAPVQIQDAVAILLKLVAQQARLSVEMSIMTGDRAGVSEAESVIITSILSLLPVVEVEIRAIVKKAGIVVIQANRWSALITASAEEL